MNILNTFKGEDIFPASDKGYRVKQKLIVGDAIIFIFNQCRGIFSRLEIHIMRDYKHY